MCLQAKIKYYSDYFKLDATLLSTETFNTKPFSKIPDDLYSSKSNHIEISLFGKTIV